MPPLVTATRAAAAPGMRPALPARRYVAAPRGRAVVARVLSEPTSQNETAAPPPAALPPAADADADAVRKRAADRKREQAMYRVAAIAATVGFLAIAATAVHARFSWHRPDGDVPTVEAAATLLLALGGVVGMEMYARWVHRALWHDTPSGWAIHKSHHEPRVGAFEANDVYALANALPATALCAYGFFTPTLVGGLAFGAGLGITLFGIAYMFVHDGLVHRRFPVGPVADVPALRRIAVAHKLHHTEKYGGVPFGMFLGPQELEALPGAAAELDRLCAEADAEAARRAALREAAAGRK